MTGARLITLAIVGTLGYLALAILGKGGLAAFLSSPPLVAIAVVTLLLALVSVFSQGNLSVGEREDRANRWVLAAFGVLGVLGAWLPAYTDRKDLWTFDGDTIRWVGVVVYIIGGILRLWPVFVLGRRFSGLVAIQPGHALVTTGVYSVIRHPSYLGLLIGLLGWALAFRSWAGVVLTALTVVPLVARIRAEETLLQSHFGSDYTSYRSRTARLIPGLY